jgi:hypothetical protein
LFIRRELPANDHKKNITSKAMIASGIIDPLIFLTPAMIKRDNDGSKYQRLCNIHTEEGYGRQQNSKGIYD